MQRNGNQKSGFRVPRSKYSYYQEPRAQKIWRSPVFVIILFGLLLGLAFYRPGKAVLDEAFYSADGMEYRATIEGRGEVKHWQGEGFLKGREVEQAFSLGRQVVIYERKTGEKSWREQKRYDFEIVGPWCISMGQLDDKPDIEVFVGAYRRTRHFPEGPRPYFFTWDSPKKALNRLWTGSYLDAPIFLEADMVDKNGDGRQEVRLKEVEWQGDIEKHYISYYTYRRELFEPVRVDREEAE